MEPQIIKEGFLTKRGNKVKNWKKRWFVFKDDKIMYYYKQKQDKKPKGIIDLNEPYKISIPVADDIDLPYVFQLFKKEAEGNDRIWYLQGSTNVEMNDWFDILISHGNVEESLPEIADEHILHVFVSDDEQQDTTDASDAEGRMPRHILSKRRPTFYSDKDAKTYQDTHSIVDSIVSRKSTNVKNMDYNSDEDVLQLLKTPQAGKPKVVVDPVQSARNVQEKTSEKKVSNMFEYFQNNSEATMENDESEEQQPTEQRRQVMEAIKEEQTNIIPPYEPKEHLDYSQVPIEVLRHRVLVKESTNKNEYDTPSDTDSDDIDTMNMETMFINKGEFYAPGGDDEFADLVRVYYGEDQKRRGWFLTKLVRCVDIFRRHPYAILTYLVSAVMVVLSCLSWFGSSLITDIFINAPGQSKEQSVVNNELTIFLIVEFIIVFLTQLFATQNKGSLSVVTTLESAISESGSYLYQFYIKGGTRQSLFLKGYVGKLMQLNFAWTIALGTFSLLLAVALVPLLLFLKQGNLDLLKLTYFYLLARSPTFYLSILWSTAQSFMFGTMQMWEWGALTISSNVVFMIVYFFIQHYTNYSHLFAYAIILNIILIFCVIFASLVFCRADFRNRHKPQEVRQNKETIGRFTKLLLFISIINNIPLVVEFIYNALMMKRSEVHFLSVNLVSNVVTTLLQFGYLYNSLAMVVGVRCVKRLKYKEWKRLMLLSTISLAVLLVGTLVYFYVGAIEFHGVLSMIQHIKDEEQKKKLKFDLLNMNQKVWHVAILSVPLTLYVNLYKTFLLCFEAYTPLIIISIVTNSLILVPLTSILGVFVYSPIGFYTARIAQQVITALCLFIVLHFMYMPKFKEYANEHEMKRIDAQHRRQNDVETFHNVPLSLDYEL